MSFSNVRFITVFLLAIATVFSFTPRLAHAADLSEVEEAYLKKKGTLVFVSQTHYPPFEFIGADGDHTGMCIDLVRWIATEFGFNVQFTDTSFKQAQDDVLSEKADILTSLFYSEKRDKVFDFTKTIFKVPASIFVMAERPDIKDINDLQGKIIAMQSGDYAQEFLDSKGIKCSYKYTTNFAEATDLVIADKADAIIGDEQIVLYHIFSNALTERIKKVGEPLYIGRNCMGAKDPNPILIGIMNKGIELAQNKGILDQIYKKWIGTRYSPQLTWILQFFPYFIFAMGGIFLMSILVWVWNIRLRQTVLDRTTKLSKSEETLRAILNASPLGIGIARNRILGWHNEALSRMLGYTQGELEGQDIKMLYPDNHHLEQAAYVSKDPAQRNSVNSVETQWIRKDGSVFPCQLRSAPLWFEDDKLMTVTIAEDISERKRAEKELIKSELRYRTLVNTMQEGLLEVDKDWRITFANDRFVRMSGYSSDQLMGTCFHDLVTKEYLPDAKKQHSLRRQGKTCSYELELVRPDGGKFFVLCSPNPLYDSEGKYLGGFGVITDITEIKRSAEMLRKSERKFKFLAENMADIVWTLDMEFKATYVSPSVEKVLGFTPEDRKKQKLEEMVTPESMERIRAMFLEELQRDKRQDVDPNRTVIAEVEYYHRNGSTVWMENIVKSIRDETGAIVGMYGVSRDITERKHTREEKEKLIAELKEALAKVKTLKGLLPICASCKKIRDDKGYWNRIEGYIQKHSEALFTHSICPECSEQLYGKESWYIDMKKHKKD